MIAGTGGGAGTATTGTGATTYGKSTGTNSLSPGSNGNYTYDTNIPGAFGAGGYADLASAANLAYKNALARINQQRQATYRQYGYLADVDPTTGVTRHLRVDPYNPYGELQTMLRDTANNFEQSRFENEDRGIFGGLANKAYTQDKYDAGKASADLGTSLQNIIGQLQDQQNQAAYERDMALANAELGAAESSIGSGSFNPGNYSGISLPSAALRAAGGISGKAAQVAAKVAAQGGGKKSGAKSGTPAWLAALHARSAAMNARYGHHTYGGRH